MRPFGFSGRSLFLSLVLFDVFIETMDTFPGRLMAGQQTLNLLILVRIQAREQVKNIRSFELKGMSHV